MKARATVLFVICAFASCCIFSHSCANTTTPPGGGPKDTIPPVLIEMIPADNAINFPRTEGTLSLEFDEYTVIKTATDIFLSPPMKKKPKTKIKGRKILINFQDTLLENTTYTLDFAQALADNNEGNIAPRIVFTFSTSDTIDSLYVTGIVNDCQTLKPEKKIFIAMYSDLTDSACFNKVPDAGTFTDEWGFFTIRGLKGIPYRMYAYSDADMDFKYNPDGDKVAFLDSAIIPSQVVDTSIYELGAFDMKDTLSCTHREPMYKLTLFSELQSIQYLQSAGRIYEKMGYMKFSAGEADIRSLQIVSIDSTDIITQFNQARDSANYWIKSKYNLPDSLLLRLSYMKTDSTGVLSLADTTVSMGMPLDTNLLKKNEQMKKDTMFAFKVLMTNETVEQNGVVLESESPILEMNLDSVKFIETNPKNQESEKKIIFSRDTVEIRKFIFKPEEPLKGGYTYNLKIPYGAFQNVYFLPNKEEDIKISIPSDENLSTLTIKMTGVGTRHIVELTDENGSKAERTFFADCDTSLVCKYLKQGKYQIRITEDRNRNGFFDMGNLLAHRQPERVIFFESEPGKKVLEIPERSEVEQEIDVKTLFK